MSLFSAFLQAKAEFGSGRAIVDDHNESPLSYGKLALAAGVLGRVLERRTAPQAPVGVLMPSVAGFMAVFLALQSIGRVVAMLNFSSGLVNIRSAIHTGGISTVITARAFIEQAKLDDVIAGLEKTGIAILYVEDLRANLSLWDKMMGAIRKWRQHRLHAALALSADDPAVILFTSGSEGTPKGVVLSHANILANVWQIRDHILLSPDDILVNPLPVFHSFGLTVGAIMPLLNGIMTYLYPSPLHYRQVPQLVSQVKATLLIATDTFNMGYARAADPDDLKTLRLVVSGAERVREETRRAWDRLSTAILLEGYGATECSPVIAANHVENNRHGTVGPLLTEQEHRLEPIEGLEDDAGRLYIRGPNVMLGYYHADRPGVLVPPAGGWHDTGDIVSFDEQGFMIIRGRAKRFAKLGGEMVSLAAVENHIAHLWPEATHVVVSLPEPKKGEQLVLVTNQPNADRAALTAFGRQQGIAELHVPKAVLVVESIPVLGSGKVDVVAVQKMAMDLRSML